MMWGPLQGHVSPKNTECGLALLYWISATGQRLSSHQMQELRERIDPLLVDLRQDPSLHPLQ